jgi:hypothetical protein
MKRTPYQRFMSARTRWLIQKQGYSSAKALQRANKDWSSMKRRRNPRVLRGEVVTLPGVPGPVKVIRQAGKKGGIFGLFGTKMILVEPLGGGEPFRVPEKALVPFSAQNPVGPGELGMVAGMGPVKVVRRGPVEGAFLGLIGGTPTVIVEGPGVPGGVAKIPRSSVAPLANPIHACPACAGPLRLRGRRSLRCPRCGVRLRVRG